MDGAVGFLYSAGAEREIVWDRRGVICKLLLHGWMDLCDGYAFSARWA
jgi:hypothetical protein